MGITLKITIDLPDNLLTKAKKRAAETRTTIQALVERGLRHELREAPRRNAARPPTLRWITVKGGLPRDLDVADRAAMMDRLR